MLNFARAPPSPSAPESKGDLQSSIIQGKGPSVEIETTASLNRPLSPDHIHYEYSNQLPKGMYANSTSIIIELPRGGTSSSTTAPMCATSPRSSDEHLQDRDSRETDHIAYKDGSYTPIPTTYKRYPSPLLYSSTMTGHDHLSDYHAPPLGGLARPSRRDSGPIDPVNCDDTPYRTYYLGPSTPQVEQSQGSSPSRSNKENKSPRSSVSPCLKLRRRRPVKNAASDFPVRDPIVPHIQSSNSLSSPSSSGSGLKIKLRGIQAALREPSQDNLRSNTLEDRIACSSARLRTSAGRKRPIADISAHDEDDTDSEIDIQPSRFFGRKTTSPARKEPNTSSVRKFKKIKTEHRGPTDHEDDAMYDAGDDDDLMPKNDASHLSLVTPVMKRTKRILDPTYPPHAILIASATKAGPEYYDSDTDDLPGDVKDTSKPSLFRNVKWGAYAMDYSNDAEFIKEPEFTQFIPGRFELQPDGTVSDQKHKLIVKLTDKSGRKRIFTNPPPRDWNDQEAITALNKRTVQQIRRNTNVRFREVVRAYVNEERRWILENLTGGKPTQGWKVFVDDFNRRFEGKVVAGAKGTRPYRSHSSLTKEVERFSAQFYMKGLVPAPVKKNKKD